MVESKLKYSLLYIISVVVFFIFMMLISLAVYVLYKKENEKVNEAYDKLKKHGFLPNDFFSLQENIGFLGFGSRVFILSKILDGKNFPLNKNIVFDSKSAREFLNQSNFKWIGYYKILVFLLISGFFVLIVAALAT